VSVRSGAIKVRRDECTISGSGCKIPTREAPLSTYVALLRGVNVGGKNKLPMAQLRSHFESLGFDNVRSLIQSGNVIFESSHVPKARHLESTIEDQFAIVSRIALRTPLELQRVVTNRPASMQDTGRLYVGFFASKPAPADVVHLDHERFLPEQFSVAGEEIYMHLPDGMAQTKLPDYLNRRLKVPVTFRNWNTVNRLLDVSMTTEPSPLGDVS
jgi:uncharacterized protein (DUF1697 family)